MTPGIEWSRRTWRDGQPQLRRTTRRGIAALGFVLAAMYGQQSFAQIHACNETPRPRFCDAAQGDRASGYLRQTRSEVVARNGMVTTSQALAAQAGLGILQQAETPSTRLSGRRPC